MKASHSFHAWRNFDWMPEFTSCENCPLFHGPVRIQFQINVPPPTKPRTTVINDESSRKHTHTFGVLMVLLVWTAKPNSQHQVWGADKKIKGQHCFHHSAAKGQIQFEFSICELLLRGTSAHSSIGWDGGSFWRRTTLENGCACFF